MPAYVILFQFTAKGIEQIKDSPDRVEALKQTFRDAGAEVREFYALLGGNYDTIFIAEAPDDETIARLSLDMGSMGFVRTETHRAFTLDEFRKLTSGL